ncbi:MAG: PIG-L family deacetylase [Planctomycetia bacterium]|nr:PIG-L family deacetylase [Planctomycetia bacterium]
MSEQNRRTFMKAAALGAVSAVAANLPNEQAAAAENQTAGYASKNFTAKSTFKKKKERSSGMDSNVPFTEIKRPLRILIFGAHPDDGELKAGGAAAKWAKQGHEVMICSVTNGNMGYWKNTGAPLAARRKAEVEKADKMLGATSKVLDIDDSTLMPTHENRLKLIKVIREWKADIVMGHRPCDYQADHRYLGVLMQDTAFMAAVPGVLPEIPAIPNPVYLYLYDYFQRPYPFIPDIAIDIDPVADLKTKAVDVMESQFYEGGCMSNDSVLPKTPEEAKKRHEEIEKILAYRNVRAANFFRDALIKQYGPEKGKKIKNAEFFEICEYGRSLTKEEIDFIFPF